MNSLLPFPDAGEIAVQNRRRPARRRNRAVETPDQDVDLFSYVAGREPGSPDGTDETPKRKHLQTPPGDMTAEDLLDALSGHLAGNSLDGDGCRDVVDELARRGETQATPLLARLCQRFAGFDKFQSSAETLTAMNALVSLADPEAARVVIDLVSRDVLGPRTTAAALRYLARIRLRAAASLATRHLRNGDPSIRRAACELTLALGLTDETDALVDLVTDPHPGVAKTAALALGRLGYLPIKGRLEDLLMAAVSVDIPLLAEALSAVADDDTAVLLWRTCERADAPGRQAIARALGRMACGNAIKSLARMARDSRASVKREVVEALETHGNVGAAKALQVLANDTDDSVRQAAMAALERIEDEML